MKHSVSIEVEQGSDVGPIRVKMEYRQDGVVVMIRRRLFSNPDTRPVSELLAIECLVSASNQVESWTRQLPLF